MSTQEITSMKTISNEENLQTFSWKEYFILAAAGLLGFVALLPTAWPSIVEFATRTNIPVRLVLGGHIILLI
jgi:hypothetical protein